MANNGIMLSIDPMRSGIANYENEELCSVQPGNSSKKCRDLKIVVVGDKGVGKTALIQQFVYERFPEVSLSEFPVWHV